MRENDNLFQIIRANGRFCDAKGYERYQTTKYPDKRMVILACMDTRLVELMERAMGIDQGQAIIVRVAGAQVQHPFGSVMQSILVAIHMLKAEEVVVVGHHDCGMQCMNTHAFVEKLMERGISKQTIQMVENSGINLENWLEKFDNVYESVRSTVSVISKHPFLAETIPVHGLVIDPHTGKLEMVVNGSQREMVLEGIV
ncbi:carbonic anhydrase [Paenibacillus sp. WST5]|uniref:carbonic anhydrase n=2 Tax=Paenibacillus sedimenti TaxID=2770274 RepID=A0A926QIZ8_9BACL|nr:carbonic anhydrase [Paenibacillus sedimenti]MBD0381040.1 carbonic anhydrase [Paenibacillus sedimenti]